MTTATETQHSTTTATPGLAQLRMLPSGVANVILGSPEERVITLTFERIKSLSEILKKLAADKPRGVVISGAHADMFTAGADISLIQNVTDRAVGEKLAHEGQQVFDAIAALACPTVAAISGPCVGGGCEMVLACSYRLISDTKSSTIGLPEIKLGILPGFGGTQRMPRLIGLPKALDIILAGKTLKPKQALKYGLVDEIVAYEQLIKRADAIISGVNTPSAARMKFTDRMLTFTSLGRKLVAKKARAGVRKETKGFYPAPPAALEAALYGLERGLKAGLENEARELGRLIVTPESKSLIRLFFLTETAKGLGKSGRKAVEDIHAVVIGAGAMGAGIAGVLARNNCSVILKDTTDEAVKRGMSQIKKYIEKAKSLSESEKSFILNRVEPTAGDSPNTSNANMVVEAVFEDMKVKKAVLGAVAKQMQPDAIVATNTSSLSVTEIASAIDNQDRVVGMHFFNPVEKMPLVEIVRGKRTSDKTIAIIAALTSKLGKFPIVVNDVPGFLVNRVLAPYLNEGAFLLQEGFAIADIDRAATTFGMPMGPIRLLDEVGLDVAAHVQETMVAGYGDRMRGPDFAAQLVKAGRKGKKSGGGFYDFNDKDSTPSSAARNILKLGPEKRGSDSRPLTERLVLNLINEAVKCLDEGVAGIPGTEAASQVDLGTVMGIGFPPFRGGVLHYADSLGAKKIYDDLLRLEKDCGSRFAPADGIRKRAENNLGFKK
jgi:3-hydroxyacyl-CoA dehydrogenase/enoyl-CoA hydratase/3-hydroxybutyryl-CoA epimerase